MKKTIVFLITVFSAISLFAGGIVTNTNHSAEFIATMNRNASTDVDAVYFNPAGLTALEDGFHLYLSSQTIFQTRTIKTVHPSYNENTFSGETFAPVFPNLYLAYKTDKFVISGGFLPIGGGGSAEFPKGLPSFDYEAAKLVGFPASLLVSKGLDPDLADSVGTITGYSMDASFTGSSVYYGAQINISYALNNMLSFAGGFRYIYAANTYQGSLEDVTLHAEDGDILGFIPNIEVDAKRTGSAFTWLGNVNITPFEGFNASFRYEAITKLKMKNETKKDDTKLIDEDGIGMFPDGAEYNSDMPAMFACGVAYKPMERLRLEFDYSYYMNTGVDWDGAEENVENGNEIGLGAEFGITESITALVGVLKSTSGALDRYQSDMSYSLDSKSVGLGIRYKISPTTRLTAGFSKTFYDEGQNEPLLSSRAEKYDKDTVVYAVGFQRDF